MVEIIPINQKMSLSLYEQQYDCSIQELRTIAQRVQQYISNRNIWMISLTVSHGGIAEMLPRKIIFLRELGYNANWAVIKTDEEKFFKITKHLHNMLHGTGDHYKFTEEDHQIYEHVNRQSALDLKRYLNYNDIIIVHDPQPMALGTILKEVMPDLKIIFRCHVGTNEFAFAKETAWEFLNRYAQYYDHSVFISEEYIPKVFENNATIITPGIDPNNFKNRELDFSRLLSILIRSKLMKADPIIYRAWDNYQVICYNFKGEPIDIKNKEDEIGFGRRPIITQISRWDVLKGFEPLLEAFVLLKKRIPFITDLRLKRVLEFLRLVLVGPEIPTFCEDNDGRKMFDRLITTFKRLPSNIQKDVYILNIPLTCVKKNALIVNAIQRSSTIIVQNSIKEAFGLTVTEALLKGRTVVGTTAWGIKMQIRDKIDGRIINNPNDSQEIANILEDILKNPKEAAIYGINGKKRAQDNYLVFQQLKKWLNVFEKVTVNNKEKTI